MKRYLLIIVITAVSVVSLASASMAAQKTFEGRKIFNTYCFLCHGLDGKGTGPLAKVMKPKPADLTATKRSDTELSDIILGRTRHGVEKEMPEWRTIIPPPHVDSLIAYIRFLSRSKYPLIANPEAGQDVYKHYCAACHGSGGKGDGVLSRIIPIKPVDHTDAKRMDEINNEQLISVIAHGKGFMPGWSGILSDHEIKAVASYIRLLSFQE